MASFSFSSSSHLEPADSELKDPFHRLPDDLLLLIIDKLLQAKALIRLSLVSKRFFSLVFQTHSVFLSLDIRQGPSFVRRVFGFLKKLVTRAWTPTILSSNCQKLYVLQRFQQIKHLHVHLCVDSAGKLTESGPFFRWVAAFGSDFEFFHLLFAESVHQSIPPVVAAAGINVNQGLNDELSERALKFYASSLEVASGAHDMIIEHVLGSEMLESVVVSNDYGKMVMGKEQIARLRSTSFSTNQEQRVSDVVGFGSYVPTLDLLELGYTLKNVLFVRAIVVNQENLAVTGANQNVEVVNVSVLDDSEFEHWKVFDQAVPLLMNDEMKIMFRV